MGSRMADLLDPMNGAWIQGMLAAKSRWEPIAGRFLGRGDRSNNSWEVANNHYGFRCFCLSGAAYFMYGQEGAGPVLLKLAHAILESGFRSPGGVNYVEGSPISFALSEEIVANWNDQDGRTQQEVVDLCKLCNV